MPDRPVLSVADLIASAVSTQKRPPYGACPDGTRERLATLSAAADAHMADLPLHDLLCDKVFTLAAFVMHCAWVEHTIAHVTPLPYAVPAHLDEDEARLRDLGRGGESKTAAAS